MILPRVITAAIGIPLLLGVIYFGSIAFFLLVSFVIIFSLYEYYIMMKTALKDIDVFSLFFCGILIPSAFYLDGLSESGNFIIMIISVSAILPFFIEIFRDERSIERIAYTYIGIFFIAYTLSHLLLIRDIPIHGRFLTYIIFISVWICDTAAYFFGIHFGKRKLSSVSPKKTVEGFFAGVFSCFIFYYFAAKNYNVLSLWQFMGLAFITSISAQYSDLAQSVIKRACGVKDSSNLLPGHGGIFDRFDSYLFLSPLFYYYYILIK